MIEGRWTLNRDRRFLVLHHESSLLRKLSKKDAIARAVLRRRGQVDAVASDGFSDQRGVPPIAFFGDEQFDPVCQIEPRENLVEAKKVITFRVAANVRRN